ncbi:outer membrane lipid asymmetry maintenance protein MlaD [Mesosutterella sp. AGMB02718]|uniref:Outer membrane lipid asymmetry maintenance protein MlaD n=1 Tax=Mesosutterella faecium TaxID=2925194 RepID=A0ABT7IK23_9BURK|nr:outer membrane lipid asymmetry maintenance protein MlaD [Mesosutterella sp. AGMB02718]MDL2058720.1 outer membrane lipid asymmetry maintenance protein MlaD [Mesosutterella sp. AGMB02718]
MEQSRKTDLLVGVFVLLGIAALLFLALKAGNMLSLNFGQKTYEVTAVFDNAGGLKPRASVSSAGVNVGRVKSISLDPQTFQAVVKLDIYSNYKFPSDTSAKILTAGLLGEKYIGLEAGSEESNLKNNDRIQQTQSSIVLENLISQFLFNTAEKKGGSPDQEAAK